MVTLVANSVIDTVATLQHLLTEMSTTLLTSQPSLYVDIEGVKLGRHGSISILTLYIPQANHVYLIDVHTLGETAFSTATDKGTSLRKILEDETIAKVFYDIRNDSDALYSLFNVSVNSIVDLQLMELATRSYSKKFVKGLGKCLAENLALSEATSSEWKQVKDAGLKLFAPGQGGDFAVFNVRPLDPALARYCAGDVCLLPDLYAVLQNRMRSVKNAAHWKRKVSEATRQRIRDSKAPNFDGQSREMARGPW